MITLKLNSEIFSLEGIEIVKRAYAGYADIENKKDKNYWILSFLNCKYDEELTIREFENYLIGLENS